MTTHSPPPKCVTCRENFANPALGTENCNACYTKFPPLTSAAAIRRVDEKRNSALSADAAHWDSVSHKRTEVREPVVTSPTQEAALSSKQEKAVQTKECCVCMMELDDTNKPCVLVPCGHAQTCLVCAEACDTCPLCRANILMRLTVLL